MGAWIMAGVTFQEAARRKILWTAVATGVGFLALFGTGMHFQVKDLSAHGVPPLIGHQVQVAMLQIGFYAVDLLAVVMTILTSVDTLSGEISSGTIQAIATKPISRWEVLMGKWLGFAGMIAIYVSGMFGGVSAIGYFIAGVRPHNTERGALLVFLAAAFRTWATAYLKTEIVHDQAQHSEDLVADGPYRHLRNPLYFANLAMAAGMGLLASRAGWIFMIVVIWLFMYRLIFREEDGLLRTQGESYRAYLKAVPRFWPSLKPRIPSAGEEPRWGQAFAGESLIWLFGAAELVFAITLNFRLMWIVFGASFVAYFLAVYLVKKRAAAGRS